MKICHVGTEIVPSKDGVVFTGGLVNNVVSLSKALSKRGHEISIITSDVNGVLQNKILKLPWGEIQPISLTHAYGSAQNNTEFLIKVLPRLVKNCADGKADIIHFHSAYSIFGVIPLLTKKFIGKPMVFSLYSPIRARTTSDRRGVYQRLSTEAFSKIFLSTPDRIICLSNNTANSVREVGFDQKRIVHIPPIIDTSRYTPSVSRQDKREELGIAADEPLLLYCGNWSEWKGVDLLIEALSEIVADIPTVKLVTAWGEPYGWYDDRKLQLGALIQRRGVRPHIVELGIVPDLNLLMAACDVFIAPFRNTDGVADQPLSILEAMACGRPVIATNVGGIPEIIEHRNNGFLIEPDDEALLAKSIRYLLNNKEEREVIGKRAAEYITKNYSEEVIAMRTESVYDEVIENHRRH